VPVDATEGRQAPAGRALVLGGGGSVGNAWLIGVVAGLVEGGVDVTRADLLVGTSAGATAAVQVAGADPVDLLAEILAAVPPRGRGSAGPAPATAARGPHVEHLERTARIIAAADSAVDMRRRMGAAALELDAASDGAGPARWRAVVAARLPRRDWPDRDLLIPAVDAGTGEPVVFDRRSGVELVDAVAASTSSGAPYRIGERRYIDGGYRRNENADLAAGYGQVVVLSPLGGRTRHPLEWGMQLAAQVDELRTGGSRVDTVVPDENSLRAFGADLMDVSRRAPAARAGHEQGLVRAAQLVEAWA
jgi:NTE family protein